MKRVAILYSEYSSTIDAIIYNLQDIASVTAIQNDDNLEKYDLVVLCGYKGKCKVNALNIHRSLLPAFNVDNPVREAVLSGVKVTGITVFYTHPRRIIAQYPIFINNGMHYDELEEEIQYLEQTIYPLIIEKIIKNEQFDVRNLMSSKKECSGNCTGCGGCKN